MSIREKTEKIIEKVKSFQHHPSDYPDLLWLVLVFLGGCINAVVIRNFVDGWFYTLQFTALDVILYLFIFGSMLFCTPLIISWFFSRNHPKKRLVSPTYMNLISFGLLFFFVYNNLENDFLSYYILGIYCLIGGLAQDGIMIYAFGKDVVSDNIIRFSIIVQSDISKVEEIVLEKQFRNLLGLKRKVQRKKDETLKLRTNKKRDWQIILEIKENKKNQTVINFVFYDEGSYYLNSILKTDDSYEYAIKQIAYIKGYFLRHYSIKVEDGPVQNAESLVMFTVDEFQGKLIRFQEMPRQKRLSIILGIILIPASIGLIFNNMIEAGFTTLVFGIGLLVNASR